MPIDEYQTFDDSELIASGFTQERLFRSGVVLSGVYRPPDFEPEQREQYRTAIGVDEAWNIAGPPPVRYGEHVERVIREAMAYLLSIGDLD